jgi:hypothetical protein
MPNETLPPMDEEGQLVLIPEEILEVREKRLRKRSIKEYLIRWKNYPLRMPRGRMNRWYGR